MIKSSLQGASRLGRGRHILAGLLISGGLLLGTAKAAAHPESPTALKHHPGSSAPCRN